MNEEKIYQLHRIYIYIYIAVWSAALTNVWFTKANRVQHRVDKVTTLTVTYVENCANLLLVSNAICINMQNISCTQIMSLQTKLIGCPNSVVESVAACLARRVAYEHIEFKRGVGEGGEDMRQRRWSRSKPRGQPLYIYIYIYIGSISSLIQISLNIIDILCLHIFFWIRSNSRITFIVFGGNWFMYCMYP